MADGLEQALSKIRPHTSSSLAHQKAPATLLKALESTFREQNTEKSPTAYFAALLTTLDSTLQTSRTSGPALGEGDVLPAELYLLALVAPFVSHPVIQSNLNTIINLSAPLFPALVPHAPPLRSQLTFYAAVLAALERSQLEAPGLRQAFGSILHLCLDPRPKVRKKAAELVRDVLANPPPPMLRHPYADRTAEWANTSLSELTAGGLPKFKGKKADTDGTDTAIHLLAFLRPVLSILPSSVSQSKIMAAFTQTYYSSPYQPFLPPYSPSLVSAIHTSRNQRIPSSPTSSLFLWMTQRILCIPSSRTSCKSSSPLLRPKRTRVLFPRGQTSSVQRW